MNKTLIFSLLAASLSASSLWASEPKVERYYEKQLTFPAGLTADQKAEMAGRLVPSAKQLAWQQLGLTAFLHFGVNTFTDREWGDGMENPAIFNPANLDADQWAQILKDAGFKLAILTAKHHDGFCLWPTATTSHSVAASPWKGGKGDVVREFVDACARHGLKVGVYLSPWDRNAPQYGNSQAYNDMFVAQLTELLTNYGPIDEVWFDGACGEGPNGKKQVYDWNRFAETIHRLQPNAVTAIMGDDVRWVGNEHGEGRTTEWTATAITPGILPWAGKANKALGLREMSPDLGGRQILKDAERVYWWPSEVDVSIRPGWFYHDDQQPKSLADLADIYLTSVGRNSTLLLNIPPDRNGRIAPADSLRLHEFGQWVAQNFSNDLTAAPKGHQVNCVELREDISKGQRVESFTVEALTNGSWTNVAEGTTVGNRRLLTFPAVSPDSLRVVVKQSRGEALLLPLQAFNVSMPQEADQLSSLLPAPSSNWKITQGAEAAIDNNPATFWTGAMPAELVIDMGNTLPVAALAYTPRQDGNTEGMISLYEISLSNDGETWTPIPASGEFSNIVNNPIPQVLTLPSPTPARFVRLKALKEVQDRPITTVAELQVLVPQP